MGQRVDLETREPFARQWLRRLEGQQHFHVIDLRGGGSADVLRVLPGGVPTEVLARMRVVFVTRGEAYIARVGEVRPLGRACDLVLEAFKTLDETAEGLPEIKQFGIHVVFGSAFRDLPYIARSGLHDHPSWRPRYLPALR